MCMYVCVRERGGGHFLLLFADEGYIALETGPMVIEPSSDIIN